jgi:uncharacterized protein YjdB
LKRLKPVVLVLSLTGLATCSRDALDPSSSAVESVIVSPSISTVAVGAFVELDAQVLGANGEAMTDRPVHWTSEDHAIATVAANGVVTARGIGSTQIAASTGGQSGIAMITVTTVPVASVLITPGNKALFVEETFQFLAQTRDGSGGVLTDRPIEWSSNNENVATVSGTGLVTAMSPGGAIITATSEGKSAPASVTVAAVPVASVQVKPPTQSLVEGQTAQLQAEPLDADGKPLVGRVIQWTTTNATVASVTSTGFVTAHASGTVTIRANCDGIVGSSAVTVTTRPPNAVIVTPAQMLVQPGRASQLTVQVLDALGGVIPNSQVTWSSADPAIATVASDGLVTGVALGNTTITATSGGKSGTAQVTVTPVPVASVVVTPSAPTIQAGRTVALTAQPLSATGQPLAGRIVTWSSSTPGIAQVSSSGVVTGISGGSTIVFASIDGVLGWANVSVVPSAVATVTVSPPTATIGVGQTATYSAVLRDAGGLVLTGRVISWWTSNTAIATVDAAGVATGVALGTATITATSEGRTGTATLTVGGRTVTVSPDSITLAPFATAKLSAVVTDPGGVNAIDKVTWSTSNSLVAQVAQDGTVSAVLPGVAIISARVGTAVGTAKVVVRLGG